ncbi:YfcL family protein [Thalassotalea sediminis]|uniref:YfcL family protein n=1 Tax=Thalassotalea sediminis TaxID=1759089 RepID=UPI002572EDBC|nr:YfcL family protein [Thalassotalea sediminis]
MKIKNLTDLYQYFDQLAEQDATSDDLFASSYIRGFISLSASEFGDESQEISSALIEHVSASMHASKKELSPDDRQIVKEYWQTLVSKIAP